MYADFYTAGESAGSAMSRIYKNIGFTGLWNGLPVRIVMIGTLTGFQWLMYATPTAPFSIDLANNEIATTPSKSI